MGSRKGGMKKIIGLPEDSWSSDEDELMTNSRENNQEQPASRSQSRRPGDVRDEEYVLMEEDNSLVISNMQNPPPGSEYKFIGTERISRMANDMQRLIAGPSHKRRRQSSSRPRNPVDVQRIADFKTLTSSILHYNSKLSKLVPAAPTQSTGNSSYKRNPIFSPRAELERSRSEPGRSEKSRINTSPQASNFVSQDNNKLYNLEVDPGPSTSGTRPPFMDIAEVPEENNNNILEERIMQVGGDPLVSSIAISMSDNEQERDMIDLSDMPIAANDRSGNFVNNNTTKTIEGNDNEQSNENPNNTMIVQNAELATTEGRIEQINPQPAEEIFTAKELNQSLLRLFECPVCMDWMEPPIAQCRRGHLVCGRCRSRLTACPVCRCIFSSVRNRAMEGVSEMLRYPCRHGCGREVKLRKRKPHEASCPARKYPCPVLACTERTPMPLLELGQHFQHKHYTILKIGKKHKFSVKLNTENHDNYLIWTLGEYFHVRVDVDFPTWGFIVYVVFVGPKCKANNFIYEVSVDGMHNARKFVYTRTTHSDIECSSQNLNRQDCFHLSIDQAINFLRSKNKNYEAEKFLNFNVSISRSDLQDPGGNESES